MRQQFPAAGSRLPLIFTRPEDDVRACREGSRLNRGGGLGSRRIGVDADLRKIRPQTRFEKGSFARRQRPPTSLKSTNPGFDSGAQSRHGSRRFPGLKELMARPASDALSPPPPRTPGRGARRWSRPRISAARRRPRYRPGDGALSVSGIRMTLSATRSASCSKRSFGAPTRSLAWMIGCESADGSHRTGRLAMRAVRDGQREAALTVLQRYGFHCGRGPGGERIRWRAIWIDAMAGLVHLNHLVSSNEPLNWNPETRRTFSSRSDT